MDAMSELAKRAVKTTRGGKEIDFFNPDPSQFCLRDIAYALSNIVRWTGHCPGMTVAQHSVIVFTLVRDAQERGLDFGGEDPREVCLAALLHDTPETYTGDISTPMKTALGDAYRSIEHRLQVAIFRWAGVDPDLVHHPLVIAADRLAMQMECMKFRDGLGADLYDGVDPGLNGEFLSAAQDQSIREAISTSCMNAEIASGRMHFIQDSKSARRVLYAHLGARFPHLVTRDAA